MIDSWLADGTLVHPLGAEPNSVHLFQAIARLAGAGVPDALPSAPATSAASATGPEPHRPTGGTRSDDEVVSSLTDLIGHHDHYCFVLVDGLGRSLSHAFPTGGFFASATMQPLRSVFPSTTAVALTSLATGRWPAEHGLTGWFTFFPEHRRVIAPLLFRERDTQTPAGELGLTMSDLVSSPPILSSFFRTVTSILPEQITRGTYAAWSRAGTPILPYRSFGHALRLARRFYRRAAGPTYAYTYVLTVDHLAHRHGITSEQVATEVERVDRLLVRLRESLPARARMIVTADHGLVDVPRERHFTFTDRDPLARTLLAGQSGEGTTPVFHVRPGMEEEFLGAFARHPAADHFTLVRPEELAARGLYGPRPVSEAMNRHLGSWVGIAPQPSIIEYVPPERESVRHTGVHGGLRPGEIEVPLFLA